MDSSESVLFRDFARLCTTIGRAAVQEGKTQPVEIFRRFTAHLRSQGLCSAYNGRVLFRLLFPEEDGRRKYGMQETRLSNLLSQVLKEIGATRKMIEGLSCWAGEPSTSLGLTSKRPGSLGDEVKRAMLTLSQDRRPFRTIQAVDELLDELSSHCAFSQNSDTGYTLEARSPKAILQELYCCATPDEAALITQIILKDLRPILTPLKMVHTTLNLLKGSRTVSAVTIWQALQIWDATLPARYRVCASITRLFDITGGEDATKLTPTVGIPVQIPKCRKGRSCKDALAPFSKSKRVFCENKADGERMQIHIDLSKPYNGQIKIFSKSQRDSTRDRFATLEIIRASLGLPQSALENSYLSQRMQDIEATQHFQETLILEAEMVAFSERTRLVDEFWRIRDLIATTARGVRRRRTRSRQSEGEDQTERETYGSSESSQEGASRPIHLSPNIGFSLESDGSDGGERHFQLIFFDILHLDGRALLEEPYFVRRRLLQQTVNVIPGFATLVTRTPIDMTRGEPSETLESILSFSISHFEEGLVLKAEESTYNSFELPWVKLKRDYIPGLGDCIDMAIVGASWDKERARELEVGTDTYTTFYVAAPCLPESVEQWSSVPHDPRGGTIEKTHLECLFTVSYGISKEQLERLNFEIKTQSLVPHSKGLSGLPYTWNLCAGLSPPKIWLPDPMLFELFGAGFDKPPGSKYYALRWPRVSKVYRAKDRHWLEGESLESYCVKAYAAVGRDPIAKSTQIQVSQMWKISPGVSPEARSIVKKKSIEFECLARLRRKRPHSSTHTSGSLAAATFHTKGSIPNEGSDQMLSGLFRGQFEDPLCLLKTVEDAEGGYDSDSGLSPRKRRRTENDTLSRDLRQPRRPPTITTLPLAWEFTSVPAEPANKEDSPTGPQVLAMSSPLPAASSPPSSPPAEVHRATEPRLSLKWLLEDSFVLVHRPMYPSPKRRKGTPSLKEILPKGRLVSTLEALLAGVSWSMRRFPFPGSIKRGIVFVDEGDVETVVNTLDTHFRAHESDVTEGWPRIYVISRAHLEDPLGWDQEKVIDVHWRSHTD